MIDIDFAVKGMGDQWGMSANPGTTTLARPCQVIATP